MTGVTNTELASAIQQVIARVDAREDELKAWQSGNPTGGPFGDGRYQITNLMGEVDYFKSPARLAFEIGLLTTAGTGAVAAAEAARDAAEDARDVATQQSTNATGAATQASQQAAQAQTFRNEAASSEANALSSRNAAQSAASSAASDRAAAQTARDAAQVAQTGAQIARADAQGFRNEAQVARDQAQSFAASINPANLATKAELQAELNALIAAAPGTLNTLNELAAALGNDPNFAATITAQIAGKANTVHTHTIAQVTGLQTALDGKSNVGHTHVIADVTGLQAALDGRALVSHTHTIAQVTGLQAALDARLPLAGGMLTGPLSVPSAFTVRAQGGTEGGEIILQRGPTSPFGGDIVFDAEGHSLRFFVNNGTTFPMFRMDYGTGEFWTSSGHRVWHTGSFDPNGKANTVHGHSVSDVSGLQSLLDNRLIRGVDQWITSADGRSRFFFQNNNRTFFGSPNGYEWRNASDAHIMSLDNAGRLFVRGDYMELEGNAPTLWWRDTNHRAFGIHVNDDVAYFMRGGTNNPSWDAAGPINGRWPMTLNLNNGWVGLAAGIDAAEVVARSTIWIGDDARLMDLNSGNTVYVVGQQNADRGYINFGNGAGNCMLGAVSGGALTYNGHTVWHSGNFDPNSRVALSEFTGGNQSLATNGYQRLPGGLILQWGSTFISANGSVVVTFPIAFPNACFIAMADGGETVTNRQDNGPAVTGYTNTTVSITNGIDVGISTRWFAIGW